MVINVGIHEFKKWNTLSGDVVYYKNLKGYIIYESDEYVSIKLI